MSFSCDVFEFSTQIVIKNVLRSWQTTRTAHYGNALPYTGGPLPGSGCHGEIQVDVIRDYEIKQAVAVVVDESASCAPSLARSRHSRFFPDFSEHALFIVIQTILAVISNV